MTTARAQTAHSFKYPLRRANLGATLALLSGLPCAIAQDCVWTQIAPAIPPSARYASPLVYDPVRARVVLFGGSDLSTGDTWEWDGTAWALRSTTGPKPRYQHAIGYHAGLGRVVLFGGNMSAPFDTHTWLWDGTQWTMLPGDNYTYNARGAAMAYDAAHQRMIMFGGLVSIPNQAPTRELDPSGLWGAVATSTLPNVRTGHAMAYDSDRARIVLYGGGDVVLQTHSARVWEFDGADAGSWTEVASAPVARSRGAMAYDSVHRRMIVAGGVSGFSEFRSDAWEYDGLAKTWTRRADDGPSRRADASLVFDQAHSDMLYFGGTNDTVTFGDFWRFNFNGTQSMFLTVVPVNTQVFAGQPASFTGSFSGATGYQWLRNNIPLVNGGTISGVNTPTLSISSTVGSDRGHYTVVATGPCGTATASADLWVSTPLECYVNCDQSTRTPYLNANDFQCFMNKFAAGDSYANCDSSTSPPVLNANDFQCFLNAFAASCP